MTGESSCLPGTLLVTSLSLSLSHSEHCIGKLSLFYWLLLHIINPRSILITKPINQRYHACAVHRGFSLQCISFHSFFLPPSLSSSSSLIFQTYQRWPCLPAMPLSSSTSVMESCHANCTRDQQTWYSSTSLLSVITVEIHLIMNDTSHQRILGLYLYFPQVPLTIFDVPLFQGICCSC